MEDSTPSEPSTTSSQGLSPRLQKYAPRLAELSARTRVPLPALGLSFLALHEITAVVPIFLIYQVLHYLGAGVGLVAYLASLESEQEQEGERGLVKRFLVDWYESGSTVMEKVGRRYGILGYEKGSTLGDERSAPHGNAAAAVADAVGAYVITKVRWWLLVSVNTRRFFQHDCTCASSPHLVLLDWHYGHSAREDHYLVNPNEHASMYLLLASTAHFAFTTNHRAELVAEVLKTLLLRLGRVRATWTLWTPSATIALLLLIPLPLPSIAALPVPILATTVFTVPSSVFTVLVFGEALALATITSCRCSLIVRVLGSLALAAALALATAFASCRHLVHATTNNLTDQLQTQKYYSPGHFRY